MEIVTIHVGELKRRDDARALDKAVVKAIAASMLEVGIINPLRVRRATIFRNGREVDGYEVIAGAHRLEASRHAMIDELPCVIVDDDDLHARLAMIDENLMRAELSPADRARDTARRKELYEELHPETQHGGSREPSRKLCDLNRFTADTASRTGRAERTVQLDAERGGKISERALALVAGTALDTGAYLDKIKKIPAGEQMARVQTDMAAPAGKKPSKTIEIPEIKDWSEVEAEQKRRLMHAWNSSSPAVQSWFRENVDTPIMDERFA